MKKLHYFVSAGLHKTLELELGKNKLIHDTMKKGHCQAGAPNTANIGHRYETHVPHQRKHVG